MKTKTLLLSIGALLVFASGCSTEKEEAVVIESSVVESEVVEPESEVIESESQVIEEPVTPELNEIDLVQSILDTAFEGAFAIEYSEFSHSFNMMPKEPQLVDEITAVMAGMVSPESWNILAEEMAKLSLAVSETMGDEEISIIILNPYDREKALLIVRNGIQEYNVTNEMRGI